MTTRSEILGTAAVVLTAAVTGGLVLPVPAFGQAVADRTLSDIKVEKLGDCTTLSINFNIRVQMLSAFPESGQELHVRLRPLDMAQALGARESLRPPSSVYSLYALSRQRPVSAMP